MRVLILYEFSNHDQIIDDLVRNLNAKELEADSLNIVTFNMKRYNGKVKPLWISLLSIISQLPKVRGIFFAWFRYSILLKLSSKYDIIDVHFFSPYFDKLILKLKEQGKKIKITIWGSDFYRASSERKEEQRKIYRIIDQIQFETKQVADDFINVFPECEGKTAIANFGIIQLEIIDKLLENDVFNAYKRKIGIPEGSVVITCGTSGNEAHQHRKIISHIEKIPQEIKDQLFLIIPMNYGGNNNYIKQIESKVRSLGIPYLLLTSFFSKEKFCEYVIASDIVITIQTSDSLSTAIQEHLYANGILISGEWLPYQILKDYGIEYKSVSMETLTDTIVDTVNNLKSINKRNANNRTIISEFSSWNNVINDWVKIYKLLGK